jgi:hypothetical protein
MTAHYTVARPRGSLLLKGGEVHVVINSYKYGRENKNKYRRMMGKWKMACN